MDIIGVVLLTTLLCFCLLIITYRVGYKAGAKKVLAVWKKTMECDEE